MFIQRGHRICPAFFVLQLKIDSSASSNPRFKFGKERIPNRFFKSSLHLDFLPERNETKICRGSLTRTCIHVLFVYFFYLHTPLKSFLGEVAWELALTAMSSRLFSYSSSSLFFGVVCGYLRDGWMDRLEEKSVAFLPALPRMHFHGVYTYFVYWELFPTTTTGFCGGKDGKEDDSFLSSFLPGPLHDLLQYLFLFLGVLNFYFSYRRYQSGLCKNTYWLTLYGRRREGRKGM